MHVRGQKKTSGVLLHPLPYALYLRYLTELSVSATHSVLYHTQLCMWVLGIRTRVFMLVEQEVFCTEPSGRWILIYKNLMGFAQSAG